MDRSYIYFDMTQSLCPVCLKKIDAKIIIKDQKLFLQKKCPQHRSFTVLLEDDIDYYHSQSLYKKSGTISRLQTKTKKGCPYDCGLCPEHEQHSCINLINITDNCDLNCPVCYAHGKKTKNFLDIRTINNMLDFLVDSEYGQAEILQISGGEPATHPDLIKIMRLARTKKIKYLMLNTNGCRIAEDPAFVRELSEFRNGFEVYLQFDGFKKSTYQKLRGTDLLTKKKKAIENLYKYQIPLTLVSVIEKKTNDDEIGKLIDFGLNTHYIRGINFQPIAYFGRTKNIRWEERMTLTGIIQQIEKQTRGMIKKSDMIPLPCDPHRISLTYLTKHRNKFIPLTRQVDIKKHLPIINNSFQFLPKDLLKNSVKDLWSLSKMFHSLNSLKDITCCLPLSPQMLSPQGRKNYVNKDTFRISIVSFLDAYNFDIKTIKSDCVHFITPDLKKIPFSVYNIFNRGKTWKK